MIVALDNPLRTCREQHELTIQVELSLWGPDTPFIVDQNGRLFSNGDWIARRGRIIYAEPHERARHPAWIGWSTLGSSLPEDRLTKDRALCGSRQGFCDGVDQVHVVQHEVLELGDGGAGR
jgi:hypothetical protein